MFTVRDAQLHALQEAARREFAAAVSSRLRTLLPVAPAAVATDEASQAFLARVTTAAAGHGITEDHAVAMLAELMLQFGEDFERSPIRDWTHQVLRQQGLPGLLKLESLRERYRALTGGRPVIAVG